MTDLTIDQIISASNKFIYRSVALVGFCKALREEIDGLTDNEKRFIDGDDIRNYLMCLLVKSTDENLSYSIKKVIIFISKCKSVSDVTVKLTMLESKGESYCAYKH